jgi:hypothetical protein
MSCAGTSPKHNILQNCTAIHLHLLCVPDPEARNTDRNRKRIAIQDQSSSQ